MKALRRHVGTSPARRLGSRSVFALSLLVFLGIGIAMVGDLSAQWWLLLIPMALLVGPVMAVRREAGTQRGDDQWGSPRG